MRRALTLLTFLLLVCPRLLAQDTGSVSGVVVSTWDGSPLVAVVVTVRGTTLAAQTDQNGRFQLNNVPPGEQVLRFSKSGFASAVVSDVRVLPGQNTTVNGNLRPEFYEMEEYVVTAEEFTEQTEQILFERQQAASMLEAIGSEQFSRLGAGDAGAIVSRVTGVSLVGGKYAVVRGLSDRYTRTLMNGLDVPSSDPYRTSPQLDLFPSSMIDRINVTKTFTPDQPAGGGGGIIDIITKPFPDKAFVKASIGMSYNPTSNFRDDFLAAPQSSMSWLDLPEGPEPLDAPLWDLNDATRPEPGRIGNSSSNESQARATERLNLANQVADLLQRLGPADFGGVEKSSPLNTSLGVSAGDTFKVFNRDFGLFAGANYGRKFEHRDDYEVARYRATTERRRGRETRSDIITDIGANANFGYRLSDNHELGFNFMLVQSINEEARRTTWTSGEEIVQGDTQEQWQLHHTDREIQNYQLRGRHDMPWADDAKFEWAVSYATTTQSEPDHRFIDYTIQADGTPQFGANNLPIPYPSRYFREIEDQSVNVRGDYTQPILIFSEDSSFKFGALQSTTDRDFREQYFRYDLVSGFDPTDPNSYLNDRAYLTYRRIARVPPLTPAGVERYNYEFARFVRTINGSPYAASQAVTAGYPMLDLGVLSWLRLIGGVRVEHTFIDIVPRDRGPSRLDQVDVLPSASAVITVRTNLNLRLAYSESIARPSFREKADFDRNYLPDLAVFAAGNPDLQMVDVASYDARIEWFPAPGDLVSAGVFRKDLNNPIELYSYSYDGSLTWINREYGEVRGIELEARKNLEFLHTSLEGLTFGANLTLIQSETEISPLEFAAKTNVLGGTTRPLYDQSPYIMNLDVSYDHPSWGTSFTIAANLTGERILLTTAQGADVYEHPPVTLDATVSQKIGKNFTVRFGIKNILDPPFRQTYGDKPSDVIRQSYHKGQTFSLSLSADF